MKFKIALSVAAILIAIILLFTRILHPNVEYSNDIQVISTGNSKFIKYEQDITKPYVKTFIDSYYSARLSGDAEKVKGYFLYGIQYTPYDDGHWPTDEWPIDLTSAEVRIRYVYIEDSRVVNGTKNELITNVSVVADIQLNGNMFEETTDIIISREASSPSNVTEKIESIDYRSSISRFISDENGLKYNVILSTEDIPSGSSAVVVASNYGEDECNQRFGGACTFLISQNPLNDNGWKVLNISGDEPGPINVDSHFAYDIDSKARILVSTESGSEYSGISSLYSIDTISGFSVMVIDFSVTWEANVPNTVTKVCSNYKLLPNEKYEIYYKGKKATFWSCVNDDHIDELTLIYFGDLLVKTINRPDGLSDADSVQIDEEGSVLVDVSSCILKDGSIDMQVYKKDYVLNLENKSIKLQ